MSAALIPTAAALLGAIIGGLLSVLASWLAQRVQAKAHRVSQEILRRQELYSAFIEAAARCYADALQHSELNTGTLARLYGDIGQMRLHSSEAVIREAHGVARRILDTYVDTNRSKEEIRDFLSRDPLDLFVGFGQACRAEIAQLEPHRPS